MPETFDADTSGQHSRSATPDDAHDDASSEQPPRKRQRVRLSCLECRRRKLSCNRGFPCDRCLKSNTPDRCQYETRTGSVVNASSGVPPAFAHLDTRRSVESADDLASLRDGPRDHDRIRKLEYEIAQLKTLLARRPTSLEGSTVAGTSSPSTQKDDPSETADPASKVSAPPTLLAGLEKGELRFFRGKEFRTRYFGPHNATMAFMKLTQLCPFVQETADQWLRPVNIHDRRDRKSREDDDRERIFQAADAHLESLLPTKEECDSLVAVYLQQFEQLHRILHVPTFQREYEKFWDPSEKRYAAFTALVLAIMAVSSCVNPNPSIKFVGMVSTAYRSSRKWIEACEEWQSHQSHKHRKLIHFQISCLLYLGKRVNSIKKKKFWTGSGSLIQDAVAVGLHREPSHLPAHISVYNQEMRRRIWSTLQELDMQASFDHGLPTLLSQLHSDVVPTSNLDDDEFDESSTCLPPSRPSKEHTFSSYQHLSRQSLPLRLELSRILTGPLAEIDYDDIIRYTNDLTQEIDALPSWESNETTEANTFAGPKRPLLAYTLLHIQLRQYILPLHQPFLKLRRTDPKYQYSEIIYYNAARDMVLLHDKLYSQGVRALNFLREDALTCAINLCSVTMLQPRDSTNMIMINAQHTVKLMEKCVAMKEDRLLRCGNLDPWSYTIMCSALGLLEAHLGMKTPEAARAASAEKFVNIYYKLMANQEVPPTNQESLENNVIDNAAITLARLKSIPPVSSQSAVGMLGIGSTLGPDGLPLSGWVLPGPDGQPGPSAPDFDFLGLNFNDMWGDSWNFT